MAEAALKRFFSCPRFAVAGASSDPSKYGHKVFAWYLAHSLPVQPINPRVPSVRVRSHDHPAISTPSQLPDDPASYGLSVITPPAVTKALLREAKEVGIKAVWLQPGSFDESILQAAKDGFETVLAGNEFGRRGEGWCVLVDGERGLRAAGRENGGRL